MYYFAYGSNMDEKDLNEWCGKKNRSFTEWKLLGTACLENYRLTFNHYSTTRKSGAANLMNIPGEKVYGLLFEINKAEDHETIKQKEGCPNVYNEISVTVDCYDKSISDVITYKVVDKKEKHSHQKPKKEYMKLILNNARINKFPDEYIRYLKSIETT